jgi:hypothetical protein
MKKKKKKNGYWTEETVRLHAKECETISEFEKKYSAGYNVARKLCIIDNLNFHRVRVKHNYWNKETILLHSKEVSRKTEFKNKYPRGYAIALELNIINNLNFKATGNKKYRCIYAFEFENNYVYVGLTYNFKQRTERHTFGKTKSSIFKFIINNPGINYTIKQLTDYIPVEEASLLEGVILNDYINNGWEKINKVKTGAVGGTSIWNKSKVMELSKNYKNATEFIKFHSGAYQYSQTNNFNQELIFKNGKVSNRLKLSEKDVKNIKALLNSNISVNEIHNCYSYITKSTIYAIKNKRIWNT